MLVWLVAKGLTPLLGEFISIFLSGTTSSKEFSTCFSFFDKSMCCFMFRMKKIVLLVLIGAAFSNQMPDVTEGKKIFEFARLSMNGIPGVFGLILMLNFRFYQSSHPVPKHLY